MRRDASTADESDVNNSGKEAESSEGAPIQAREGEDQSTEPGGESQDQSAISLIAKFAERDTRESVRKPNSDMTAENCSDALSKAKHKLIKKLNQEKDDPRQNNDCDGTREVLESDISAKDRPVLDFNQRIAEQEAAVRSRRQQSSEPEDEKEILVSQPSPIKSSPGVIQGAFDRMRPRRDPLEVATITIGSKMTTSPLRPLSSKMQRTGAAPSASTRTRSSAKSSSTQKFSSSMKGFAAPGSKITTLVGSRGDELNNDEEDATNASDPEVDDTVSETVSEDGESEQEEIEGAALEDSGAESHEPGEDLKVDPEVEDSDDEYLDEEGKKAREDARVAELIDLAEAKSTAPSHNNVKRAHNLLKGGGQKDSTTDLIQLVQTSVERINTQLRSLQKAMLDASQDSHDQNPTTLSEEHSPEDSLSLTVSKEDFSHMRIIGQFNLGFILAVRPSNPSSTTTSSNPPSSPSPSDELFIIDQHASDEKSNFERLQSTTVLQHQRLVRPKPLELTAIEEETILENNDTLLRNGFVVAVDESGDEPVGRRCWLLSLPMSKEITFDLSDLEELIALLADAPPLTTAQQNNHFPRPSKTRRLFAMRACRSSVMIGKALSSAQMRKLVSRMGEIEKPWNCPHGRPTMRHLISLGGWEGWREGEGVGGVGVGDRGSELEDGREGGGRADWRAWVAGMRGDEEGSGDEEGEEKIDQDDEDEDEMTDRERRRK